MTWYRLYRPRTVAGLHLTKVRQALSQFLEQGHIPQVLLFAGPKGTGKTSSARIIAAVLNDPQNREVVETVYLQRQKAKKPLREPQAQLESLDKIFSGQSFLVQELDAASNRGIDDVRALKERVNLAPPEGPMSVYILDEAHMLTTEAFNALLKLLEEPPAHTVFILATTELHKLPATVVSRCAVVSFSKATPAELSQALEHVLKAEKITFEPTALTQVAEYADGSFRDAVKALELVCQGQSHLTEAMVQQYLLGSSHDTVTELLQAVMQKQATQVSQIFTQLRQQQVDADFFFKQLCRFLHRALMQSLGLEPGTTQIPQAAAHYLLSELQGLSANPSTGIPFLSLELKLLGMIFKSQAKSSASGSTKSTPVKNSPLAPAPKSEGSSEMTAVELSSSELAAVSDSQLNLALATSTQPPDVVTVSLPNASVVMSDNLKDVPVGDSSLLLSHWEAFVELVRDKNSSIAALLRSAKVISGDKGKATIAVFYKFHKEQLQQPKFRKMIEDCIEPLTGGKVDLEIILAEPAVAVTETQTKPEDLSALAEELLV